MQILDKKFKPAIVELRNFKKDVLVSNNSNKLIIAVKRNGGYIFHKEIDVFKDGIGNDTI